jgi:hypothetical protein
MCLLLAQSRPKPSAHIKPTAHARSCTLIGGGAPRCQRVSNSVPRKGLVTISAHQLQHAVLYCENDATAGDLTFPINIVTWEGTTDLDGTENNLTTRSAGNPSYRNADNRNSSTECNMDCNNTVGNKAGSTAKRNRGGNSRSSLGSNRFHRWLATARLAQLVGPRI